MVPNRDIAKAIDFKIKQLKEGSSEHLVVVNGDINNLQFNDDIKREQEFYRITESNLKLFKSNNTILVEARQDALFKDIKEVVHNGILKQAVYIKNEDERELRAQGKKLQTMIAAKSMSEEKQQKLLIQIKKALAKEPRPDDELEEEPEQQRHQQRPIHKKGFKLKKGKRAGKVARTRIRAKANSRR